MLPVLLQVQEDIFVRLSEELLAWGVNVSKQRDLIIANQLSEKQLCLTITNGRSGSGVLVCMPTFENKSPDTPGPYGVLEIVIASLEIPELNLNASTGTLHTAEELAMRVCQLLHHFYVADLGTFYAAPQSIKRAVTEPGVLGYDSIVRLEIGNEVLAQCGTPTISGTFAAVTLTNAIGYAGASIYYTTDGESAPGPHQQKSYLYSAPFAVASGTTVRAAAFLPGYTGSNIISDTFNS